MNEIKEYIVSVIIDTLKSTYEIDMNKEEIYGMLEKPKDENMGDIAFPCFKLSKALRNSPLNIANDLQSKIVINEKISKIESVSGYLNFSINDNSISSKVITKILDEKENYGFNNIGNNQNISIDYSSPNIAKPFHLGHLRTTIIGRTLYNLYGELGYNCIGTNYLGDWGRQFGLLIEGYRRFKNDYNVEDDALHILADIYTKINTLAKEDESIFDIARENFKKLEEGDEELLDLWKYFRDISLKEYERIYDILGCKFDSYNGEAFYNDKMTEVIDILEDKGVLTESQGAKVVMLGENEPPCLIVKSNGSTIYATRDLAAILYRARTYDYVKSIYVTGYEQIHHFKQVFAVAKHIVDEKYTKELVHVPYGMVRLKTGKMSSREGTLIYLQDLIEEAISKAKRIIEEKSADIDDKDTLARQIGVGAVVFNDLKHNKIKDVIFDLDETLRFDGETGPYVQYTYARICSIIKKSEMDISNIKFDDEYKYNSEEMKLIKLLENFSNIIKEAAENYEPAILTRYIIDVASSFSTFYNNNNIITSEENTKVARVVLSYVTGIVLKKGLGILGIEAPEKM